MYCGCKFHILNVWRSTFFCLFWISSFQSQSWADASLIEFPPMLHNCIACLRESHNPTVLNFKRDEKSFLRAPLCANGDLGQLWENLENKTFFLPDRLPSVPDFPSPNFALTTWPLQTTTILYINETAIWKQKSPAKTASFIGSGTGLRNWQWQKNKNDNMRRQTQDLNTKSSFLNLHFISVHSSCTQRAYAHSSPSSACIQCHIRGRQTYAHV